MRRIIVYLVAIAMLPLLVAYGQITSNYYWTAPEKQPKWVHAVDVAFGAYDEDNDLAWHRYLLGSNEIDRNLYWADPLSPDWTLWGELPYANKIISYRNENDNTTSGNIAFCSAYGVKIYRSTTGGGSWGVVPGSDGLENKQFTAIEIKPGSPGTEVYVGCEALTGEASVYKGVQVDPNSWDWDPLSDGLIGITVHDLGSIPHYD
jgi:hypothetical protein